VTATDGRQAEKADCQIEDQVNCFVQHPISLRPTIPGGESDWGYCSSNLPVEQV
jgi:hypothetical protein